MADFVVDYYPLLISVFCAAILAFIIGALVFRPQFRKDLLSAEGEASILKIVSIKGVALLAFVALFAFGTLYPFWVYSEHCNETVNSPRDIAAAIQIIDDYVQEKVPEDIQSYVIPLTDDLKNSFGQLDEGTLIIYGAFAGARPALENLAKMKSGDVVLATHVPAKHRGLEDMHAWYDTRLRKWFEHNVEAIDNGVNIRRIFILRRDDLIEPGQSCIKDARSVEIMQMHEDAGIEVYLTWLEDIERQRDVEDSILFGNRLVQVNQSAWDKQGHNEILVSVNSRIISGYRRRWNQWQAAGRTLSEVLQLYSEPESQAIRYCVED
jgi:hypothetical protein